MAGLLAVLWSDGATQVRRTEPLDGFDDGSGGYVVIWEY
jgi:hypothetical protein